MAQNKTISSIAKLIDRRANNLPAKATVVRVDQLVADITLGPGSGTIHNVEIMGNPETLSVGMVVPIQWVERQGGYLAPVIFQGGGAPVAGRQTYVSTDNITLQMLDGMLRVKPGGVGLEHLDFVPALSTHSHDDPVGLSGWSANEEAIVSNGGELKLYSNGRIYAGVNDEVVIIDTTHASYRMWAGHYDPTDAAAVFKVGKDGKMYATGGAIAGWTINTDQFSADSGQAILNSAVPFLGLGGADVYGEAGIWLGKDAGVYKLYIGDPAGNNLNWDGSSLSLTGSIMAEAGFIGGWEIYADMLACGAGGLCRIALNADQTPYIAIGQSTGYLGSMGFWAGLESSTIKMHIGDPDGNLLSWNGSVLSVKGDIIATTITAASGTIGGWTLSASAIGAGGIGNDQIELDASVPSIAIGGTTGFLGGSGFWVGMDGSLAKMHIGDPSTDFMAWDGSKLIVAGAIFAAENITGVIGGSLMISKDRGTLPAAITAVQATINFGRSMTPDDFILIRARDTSDTIREEYIQVGTLIDGTTYNVTRGLSNGGTGFAFPIDTIFIVLGNEGDGHIELDAIGAPGIIVREQGDTYNSQLERIKLDNSGLKITYPPTLSSNKYLHLAVDGATGFGRMDASIQSGETNDVTLRVYATNGQNYPDDRSVYFNIRNFLASTEMVVFDISQMGGGIAWHLIELTSSGNLFLSDTSLDNSGGNLTVDRAIYAGTDITAGGDITATGSVSGADLIASNTIELFELAAVPSAPTSGYAKIFGYDGAAWVYGEDGTKPHNLYQDEFWISPDACYVSNAITSSNIRFVQLRDAQGDVMKFTLSSPKGWAGRTVYWDVYLTSAGAGTATFYCEGQVRPIAAGTGYTSASYTGASTITPNGTPGVLVKKTYQITWPICEMAEIQFQRLGSHASDNNTATMLVAGIRLRVWN